MVWQLKPTWVNAIELFGTVVNVDYFAFLFLNNNYTCGNRPDYCL